MRRKLFFAALVGVALIGALVIVRFLPESRKASAAPAAAGGGRGGGAPLPVYTYEVTARPLTERITATGAIVADEAVDLVAEVAGKVTAVLFEEGAQVSRGDVLLKIDDVELRAQLDRAESRIELARVEAERQRNLLDAAGTSRATYDAAINQVRVLEAEAALARAQLAKTELRAPFDGAIGLRYVSEGAYVTPTTRIASLQKIDTVKVEFSVAERHLERLQPDAEVRVTVAGLSEPFSGRVYAIEPRIEVATRTLRLRARAENPEGRVLPGGFATVELPLRVIPEALLVPADAIVAGLNEQRVYVLEDGRAQPRTIQTGLRLAREVQVVSGLEPGAIVITSGQLQLRPGMSVQPVERSPASSPQSEAAAAVTATEAPPAP